MYMFCERGIRGGISVITHRYAKANNRYLPDYHEKEESSYLMFLDANNLYGWAMSQKLPEGDCQWTNEFDKPRKNMLLLNEYILNYDADDERGYILEVDILYLELLHDKHNQYPLAPERMIVTEDIFSEKAKQIRDKIYGKHYRSVKVENLSAI